MYLLLHYTSIFVYDSKINDAFILITPDLVSLKILSCALQTVL